METKQGSLNVDERFIQQESKRKPNIPKRLRLLAIEMRETAKELQDNTQDRHWLGYAEELQGAAEICQEWSKYLGKEIRETDKPS